MENREMLTKMANSIRFLATDMIQRANSGHPGAPMGLADIMTVLSSHLNHNPKNPNWLNRDRVVFSGGHASGLIYSMLYLWGYDDITMDELKNFRQFGSKTEGHPESNKINGIEVTTGPLGQGVANAVGFAMAQKYAQNLLNRENSNIIDHKVYCLCGDGDLQEGISYEACSLAGHHKLKDLVIIYDSNEITIEGNTNLAWSENVEGRFEAQGFEVITIDGHNLDEIESSLNQAKNSDKPTLIIAKTKIAKGSKNMEGSHKTHGAPLGVDEIKASKELAGFDPNKEFFVDEDVLARFRVAIERGNMLEREWNHSLGQMPYKEQNELLEKLLNPDFSKVEFPEFNVGDKLATRDSNGKIINAIAKASASFIGGSADLAPSNKTDLKDLGIFPTGRNIHFGIREHAMAGITNAISQYGLFTPFSSTFFVFSDYLMGSARIASLMGAKHFFIWTHDSIGVGEDGPTHQPVEQLAQFRSLPDFYTFRPADAIENIEAWKVALNLNGPSGFVLSRQGLPVFDKSNSSGEISKGGYLVQSSENAKVTLLATGSEVALILEAKEILENRAIAVNIVSVPCYELFDKQDKAYKDSIIKPDTKVLAVEASRGLEWYKFADDVLSMESFGASGPANELFKHFGFTAENVANRAEKLI